jgi:3' terminal RNA ribose 2'-O-methyltransferase Hen1
MLLTISTDHSPATDLGHLLGRNPDRCHSFTLPFGKAHVFYPVSSEFECTAALLLDVDSVRFGRDARSRVNEPKTLANYVNDRQYVASSLMSTAVARVFAGAMKGESRDRQKLVDTAIPLSATLAAVRSREGDDFVRRLFEPLGYSVDARPLAFDPKIPGSAESPYFAVTIRGRVRLKDLVAHLHVLLPVIDDDGDTELLDEETKKLVERRAGWLKAHPERERIALRYLNPQRRLVPEALARLVADDELDLAAVEDDNARREALLDATADIPKLRAKAVVAALRAAGARRIIDLGCGDVDVIKAMFQDPYFERVVGVDVSQRAIDRSPTRLGIDRLTPQARSRVELFHGSPTYRDERFAGYDAACLAETIEHFDPEKLTAVERVVFEYASLATVVVTTPNAEFNARLPGLEPGSRRNPDHRFEWTRRQFQGWAEEVGTRFGYRHKFVSIGAEDPELGPPTQMAVFTR